MVNNRHDWGSKQQRMISHLFALGTKSLSLEESPPQTEAALYTVTARLQELQDGSRKNAIQREFKWAFMLLRGTPKSSKCHMLTQLKT